MSNYEAIKLLQDWGGHKLGAILTVSAGQAGVLISRKMAKAHDPNATPEPTPEPKPKPAKRTRKKRTKKQ